MLLPLIAGGLAAGADVVGNLLQNQAQQQQADRANAFTERMANSAQSFSAQQAEIAREYGERMSSTAHQREVADLKAAGLNPILAAGGQGASAPSSPSPSGVSGSGQQAAMKNLLSGMTASAQQGMALAQMAKTFDTMVQQQSAELALTRMQEAVGHSTAEKNWESIKNLFLGQKQTIATTEATQANVWQTQQLNKLLEETSSGAMGKTLGPALKLLLPLLQGGKR